MKLNLARPLGAALGLTRPWEWVPEGPTPPADLYGCGRPGGARAADVRNRGRHASIGLWTWRSIVEGVRWPYQRCAHFLHHDPQSEEDPPEEKGGNNRANRAHTRRRKQHRRDRWNPCIQGRQTGIAGDLLLLERDTHDLSLSISLPSTLSLGL